jgi:hypothetical protein
VSSLPGFKTDFMKKYCLPVLLMLLFSNCSKEVDDNSTVYGISLAQSVCGTNMAWLQDIITKADEDKATKKYMGMYMGAIYLTTYQNRDVYLIDMNMGSGGIMFYLFDCNHQPVNVVVANGQTSYLFSDTQKYGKIIYKNR